MTNPSFQICVDESGDQGFRFDSDGCSHWLVVSGVVSLSHSTPKLTELVKNIKADIGWTRNRALHFKDVKGEDKRRLVIERISERHKLLRAVTVMVNKTCLASPEAFSGENRLLFYATRFLLERASWLCKNSREFAQRQHGDGTAKVIFSNMGEVSRHQICEYFKRLQQQDTAIDWEVICASRFETLSPGMHAGLQIADCVASGFYCAEHHRKKSHTREWAEKLKPIVYRSPRGRYMGYGLKLYPEKEIAQGGCASWATEFYR